MPRKKGVSRNPPGVLCFPLDGSGSISRRTRYEPEQRRKVAEVRAIGACLRCQLMKVPCSGGRPCITCAQATFSARASSYLWLRSCVPSALADLKKFFKADIPIDNYKIETILSKNNHLVLSSVFLEFHDRVAWDLAALSRDWALGLSQNNSVPVMSKVGIMSSLRFQQLMSPLITNKLGSYFRLMMHTSSIIYSLGPQDSYCGIPPDDFYSLRSHAGTRVLVGLERLIRPTELANASPEKLRAIFLLLFGTILAVLYNEREEDSTAIMLLQNPVQRVSAREFSQLQDQLVLVLAHRLVDIADRLALLEVGVSKQHLIDSAKQHWNIPANFIWQDSMIPFESAMSSESSISSGLSSLCGGQMKHLEGRCSYYTFDESTGSEDRLNLFTRPPTVPVIVGRDTILESLPTPAPIALRCKNCGIVLPDGVPDMICFTCAFIDWGLFEPETKGLNPTDSLSHINPEQPVQNTGNLYILNGIVPDFANNELAEYGPIFESGDTIPRNVSSIHDDVGRGYSCNVTRGQKAKLCLQDKTIAMQDNLMYPRTVSHCSHCFAIGSPGETFCVCGYIFNNPIGNLDSVLAIDKTAQADTSTANFGDNIASHSESTTSSKTPAPFQLGDSTQQDVLAQSPYFDFVEGHNMAQSSDPEFVNAVNGRARTSIPLSKVNNNSAKMATTCVPAKLGENNFYGRRIRCKAVPRSSTLKEKFLAFRAFLI